MIPMRERTAARRHTFAPIRVSFQSCSEGGFHSAGATGSTSTIPTVSPGKRAAKRGMVNPPNECPTST